MLMLRSMWDINLFIGNGVKKEPPRSGRLFGTKVTFSLSADTFFPNRGRCGRCHPRVVLKSKGCKPITDFGVKHCNCNHEADFSKCQCLLSTRHTRKFSRLLLQKTWRVIFLFLARQTKNSRAGTKKFWFHFSEKQGREMSEFWSVKW